MRVSHSLRGGSDGSLSVGRAAGMATLQFLSPSWGVKSCTSLQLLLKGLSPEALN